MGEVEDGDEYGKDGSGSEKEDVDYQVVRKLRKYTYKNRRRPRPGTTSPRNQRRLVLLTSTAADLNCMVCCPRLSCSQNFNTIHLAAKIKLVLAINYHATNVSSVKL